jgi:hypothetical protein
MRAPRLVAWATAASGLVCGVWSASAQTQSPSPMSPGATSDAASDPAGGSGLPLPDSNRLRFTIDFMAGYGSDMANATLGFEKQGRVGYVILTALGELNSRVSYRLAINPVTETQPLPACGSAGFFFPNDPKFLYGDSTTIPCDPAYGNRRVDQYRGIALDVVQQQGPIREAWMQFRLLPGTKLTIGRMRLPIGFDWQEAGSFTAKDATEIQRIDSQSNFGLMFSYEHAARGRPQPLFSASATADMGDTNRFWDYDYYYFEDGSFATNSQLTMLLSARSSPVKMLDLRASYQYGDTGSKVERLPSYWASKRNDNAMTLSAELRPTSFSRILYEHASYLWGPRPSSADLLDVSPNPIHKRGFDTTAEAWWPVTSSVRIGVSGTYEEIDRADSLIRWLASQNLDDVTMGKHDRMTVGRAYVDFGSLVRVAFYKTNDSNPFPWVSGISAVTGPRAFMGSNTNKWGIVVRMQVR